MIVRKKIISILICASMLFALGSFSVFAGEYNLIDLDFEDITFEEFSDLENVTVKNGISGDFIGIEEESSGNMALKLFRKDADVAETTDELGFNYKLPRTLTSGKVNVSFKIKAENTYRSRWADAGTALTSSGKRKLSLFSHSSWLWAQATGSGRWNANINYSGTWTTINYELDISNNKFVIWSEKNGSVSAKESYDCDAGDMAYISFGIAKRSIWWSDSNSGDLFYWIDDIKVSVDRLVVTSANIEKGAREVLPDTPVIINFDSAVQESSVSSSNFTIEKNGTAVGAKITRLSGTAVSIMPEEGFQYNTDYRIKVNKNILSEQNKEMAEDYILFFKTLSVIKTDIKEGKKYPCGYVPIIEKMPDISYNILLSHNEGEYLPYDGAAIEELGDYTIKIIAEDTKGRIQEQKFDFMVIGKVAPTAENVIITGIPVIGSTLKADYTYIDENEDEEGKSIYKWYKASAGDESYTEIEGANSKEYILSEEDEDSYIKFGVTPVSVKEPYIGEEVLSEAFLGAMNPVAEKISVLGTIGQGSELEAIYEYYDENNDEEITDGENATIITWYSSDKKDGNFEKIATGKKYVLTETENEHWLKIGVVPKNDGSGKQSREFFSEIFAGAFAPYAQDVKIIGKLKAGSVVGVDYKYADYNSDSQGKTKIEWYIGGALKASGESITIDDEDRGKSIYVVVTPVAETEPCIGKPVQSSVGKISSENSSTVTSGGKGSGGSGGGSGTTVISSNPNTSVDKDNVTKPENANSGNENKISFDDIYGHWAKDEIIAMAEKNIIKGKTEKLFSPDDNITRAEFAALVARALGLNKSECEFSDVNKEDWFYDDVSAAAKAGYMNGFDGKFNPNAYITRQEIAVVLSRIAKDMGMMSKESAHEFNDAESIADWAKSSVEFAASLGLIKGTDDGNFAPEKEATRAETVVMLSRITEQ